MVSKNSRTACILIVVMLVTSILLLTGCSTSGKAKDVETAAALEQRNDAAINDSAASEQSSVAANVTSAANGQSDASAANKQSNAPVSDQSKTPAAIELKNTHTSENSQFIEQVKSLPEVKLNINLKEIKKLELDNAGTRKVIIRFYSESGNNGENSEIIAFLEYEDKTFGLGVISNYGTDKTDIKSTDINNNGINELVITGETGATASVTKILGYNAAENIWEQLLETGYSILADMDNNGEIEIISTSQGSLPPYVWIYSWNGSGYERLDAAKATGNDYAILKKLNTGYWIEAGKTGDQKSNLYYYKDGKLFQ